VSSFQLSQSDTCVKAFVQNENVIELCRLSWTVWQVFMLLLPILWRHYVFDLSDRLCMHAFIHVFPG